MASKTGRPRRAAMPSPEAIDALYGLEPVFEPGSSAHPEDWADAGCPYCGETVLVQADLTAGSRSYIEDCTVCCRPYVVNLRVDARGRLRRVTLERSD